MADERKDVEKLIQRLEQNDLTLTSLDLSDSIITKLQRERLWAALKTNKILEKLNLSHTGLTDEDVSKLSESLKNENYRIDAYYNENAEVIDPLSRNPVLNLFGINEPKHIMSEFKAGNQHLKELDLSGNKIKISGAKSLANAIKQNRSLEKINLDNNRIESEGASALYTALMEDNKVIIKTIDVYESKEDVLNLSRDIREVKTKNFIPTEENTFRKICKPLPKEEWKEELRRNRTLKQLSIANNNVSSFIETKVSDAIEANAKSQVLPERLKTRLEELDRSEKSQAQTPKSEYDITLREPSQRPHIPGMY